MLSWFNFYYFELLIKIIRLDLFSGFRCIKRVINNAYLDAPILGHYLIIYTL